MNWTYDPKEDTPAQYYLGSVREYAARYSRWQHLGEEFAAPISGDATSIVKGKAA